MSRAVVIGGGFYGASIAIYLKTVRGLEHVHLIEARPRLMERASYTNQARVHRGCHYPRSFTTAYRSIVNAPRFERDFGAAIFDRFTCLYAIARRSSKVTARQMERFCRSAGIPIKPAAAAEARLFDADLVDQVYETVEKAFDADVLRGEMERRLTDVGVEVMRDCRIETLTQMDNELTLEGRRGPEAVRLRADFAMNCTYSGLQSLVRDDRGPLPLKHEISEMVLVEPPPALREFGITLMDGPFFSMMPFPARRLHSLSHVRYTPHAAWTDADGPDPDVRMQEMTLHSRASRMIRDAARYVPTIGESRVQTSLFEVKTVLTRNETDDGRPILLKRHGPHGRIYSVLGGKIDNVYDILDRLDDEALPEEGGGSWTD